jgi:predicted ABC-type ATPase
VSDAVDHRHRTHALKTQNGLPSKQGVRLSEASPIVVVLAGPNGAGKSTDAPALLQGTLGVTEFVNADDIARGLSSFNAERAALPAGRVMLARLRELARQRISFAFETTLASRSFAPWLTNLKQSGYSVHIVFLWLPSAEFAIDRVADRVRLGGHDVPEKIIRRRHASGIRNFFGIYERLATSWRVYDNSAGAPRLIAERLDKQGVSVYDQQAWAAIVRQGSHE